MPQYETTVEEEIADQGLQEVLGVGRGVLAVDGISRELAELDSDNRGTVYQFICERDNFGTDGRELAYALSKERPDTLELIDGLAKSNVRGATDALLTSGTKYQRDIMTYRLRRYAELVDPTGSAYELAPSEATPEEIRTGLWRDAVRTSMAGTPEAAALLLARKWLYDASDDPRKANTALRNKMPDLHGFGSTIFPSEQTYLPQYDLEGNVTGTQAYEREGHAGNVYPELARTYRQIRTRLARRNPMESEQELEHASVLELAHLVARSTGYNDPHVDKDQGYTGGFAESLAWAQLDDQVRTRLKGMRRKVRGINLQNIGRFIGKSGDNPYEADWQTIEECAGSVSPDNVEPARDYFRAKIAKRTAAAWKRDPAKQDLQGSIRDEMAELIALAGQSDEAVLERFHAERVRVRAKREKHMSLAHKALDLYFMSGQGEGGAVDWINTAPVGLINWTHQALNRGVEPKTAFSYAAATQLFPGQAVTRELMKSCEGLTGYAVRHVSYIQDKLGEQAKALTPSQLVRLAKMSQHFLAEDVTSLLEQGYSADQIIQHPWLCKYVLDKREDGEESQVDFPAGGTGVQKQRWCVDHGLTYLEGDWNKATLGKMILTRLQAGVDTSLHDATQWLGAFKIPMLAVNARELTAAVAERGGPITLAAGGYDRLYDVTLERSFLGSVIAAPPELRRRLLLPGKEQKIRQMFSTPGHQIVYSALLEMYRDDSTVVDLERLEKSAVDRVGAYLERNTAAKDTGFRISRDVLEEEVQRVFRHLGGPAGARLAEGFSITEGVQVLSRLGENRKTYIDDTTAWLTRHMTSPGDRLSKVWGDRPAALAAGVADNARDIAIWQAENALVAYLTDYSVPNVTVEDIRGEYADWAQELSRCYDSRTVVQAIASQKRLRETHQGASDGELLPPQVVAISTPAGTFTGEVLSKRDPRGCTIGPDTGCCMRFDGASEDCIESGYTDKNAGFFALYDPRGNICAQSYFYVNPANPEVLVLDNIEANQGRDTDRIVEAYTKAFTAYLTDRFTADSEWRVRRVQVGTGYGDAVKSTLLRLPKAKIVYNADSEVYSDADVDQRLLFELSREQVEAARHARLRRADTPERVSPRHTPEISIEPAELARMPIISEIEAQAYPPHIRQYGDEDMLEDELRMPGSRSFSFLVSENTDATTDYQGYVLAYYDESRVHPERNEDVLYVADMAVVPQAQGNRLGAKMFDELLTRAERHDVHTIEFEARESTSYAALKNSAWTNRVLYNHGYTMTDRGPAEVFEDENGKTERLFLITIEKLTE